MPGHSLILLVDGNARERETAAQILRQAGQRVDEAGDGEQALQRARENPPALILLEVVLPGMSGYDVLRELRANPATEHIPVVFLSSQKSSPEDLVEGLDLGSDGFISRPIAESEFLARVRLHLRQIELNKQLRASEARFRDLILHQADGVLVVDREGMIQFANPAAGDLFGRASNSLAGQPFGFPIEGKETHEIEILRPTGEGIVAEIHVNETEWEGRPAWVATLRDITERARAQAERSRSEALLRLAGRVARIGGWSIELPERKLTQSKEVRAIHEIFDGPQLTVEEAINFYPPEYRAEVARLVERCITNGTPFQFEMELITAKGRRIPVLAIGEAVRNETGEIVRVQGAFQDLSEVKAAEASTEASERRFRQLAESMPMIVWTADAEGNIDYANQRLFEFTEADPSENPHTRWQHVVHPEDLPRVLSEWDRCVREQTPFDTEYRIRNRDDQQYHWFRVQSQPVRDPDGTVSRWFGTGIDIHKIKSLEEKATRLADHLARTFESITDGFFTLDQVWRFTYVNAELERFLDRSREELLAKSIWDEYPEFLGTRIEDACRKAVEENATIRINEFHAPMQRWLGLRVYPSADGVSIFIQDITQRKADEEQMRLLATAMTSLNDIVIVTKAEPLELPGPEIVFVNEAFEKLTKYTASEVIGKSPRILQGPGSNREALKRIREALSAGRPIREEVVNYAKDGQGYLLQVNIQPVRNSEGALTHYVAIQRDVTQQRADEEALRESEARFQTLLQDVPNVAIQGYGIDGKVHYWNKASEALYGYTREEALQSNLLELIIPPEMRSAVQGALRVVEEGVDHIPTEELSLVRKDGSRVDVLSSHAVLRRPGSPVELFCIDIDLTERKKLEAQFLRAQRLESIGTLAGGIAHDLNNMLAPVIMGASLMRRLDDAKPLLPIIDQIQSSAERGRDLVKQVLAFARGADGVRTILDVADLVRDVKSIINSIFPKNISWEQEISKDLWKISADFTQLNQVLLNLCVNARDAMPEGGRLRLTAENVTVDRHYAAMFTEAHPGRYVMIAVYDDGVGMDTATQNRVFEPFFTTKEFGEGTGLGLSTVMGIVRGHGGFINVYSEPKAGTRFNVYFPAAADGSQPVEQASTRSGEAMPRGNGECILVVDDEAPILKMSKLTLESYGYKVHTALNGVEGIKIFVENYADIDLLVTDIMMPIMDGIALIHSVKTIVPDLPVIAMSGLKANGNKSRATDAGVTDFLSKPFSAETLLDAIKGALNRQPKGKQKGRC